jgi:two-component system sensor histidine kinase KdpD
MLADRADHFLRLIRRARRGRLKIYLGYAAGVGKTYQMLEEAQRLKAEGVDVVVGVVETHGRAETEAMLAGLELVPRKHTAYRGIDLSEMDLEAILARRPAVVLVDELAHTNVPGSKNGKRYEDVEEILTAGIHVISTLNVQHLESLYETVERATGVKVKERVPDPVVAGADQLVNVDISSQDLRQRLEEGKIYTSERIATALDHFFQPTNLEQLRELTLREIAAQIDSRRRGDVLAEAAPASPDQVMVCLSSRGPNSDALLRYASRLAGRLNRNWYAVYVQTSSERPTAVDASTQRILSNTLTLAKQLGATVFTYRGDDVVQTILQFAKEYRVGHIVIGKPGRRLPFWRRLLGEVGIVERLITESTGRTVVVLDTTGIHEEPGRSPEAAGEAPAPAPPDRPRSVLSSARVVVWEESVGKERALRELVDVACRDVPRLRDIAWAALLKRAAQGGTLVGDHVSIAHARVSGIGTPMVVVGVGKQGIGDPQSSESVVQIMFLLLAPPAPPEAHLAALGEVSRLAGDDRWRQAAMAASAPAEVVRLLRAWTARPRAPEAP